MGLAERIRATLIEAGYTDLASVVLDDGPRMAFTRPLTDEERTTIQNAVIVAG